MKEILLMIKENRWTSVLLPIISLAIIGFIFTVITKGRFTEFRNLKIILEQALIVATVATGASYIFATGNINIAMGSATALTATLAALVYLKTESILLMFCVAIILGVLIMVAAALLSTIFRVVVIFVTIVMMVLLSAIKAEILGGGTLSLPYDMTSGLQAANIPYIIFGVFFILCVIVFHKTKIGRTLRMVGSNPISAEFTGLSKNQAILIAFIVAGIGAGLGALLTIIRSGSITVATGNTMNMDVMLAIVLGGMPVFGGSKSKAYAAAIGAITVTALNNGLLLIGVSTIILQTIRGIIFLVLVLMGNKRSKLLPTREG